MASLLGADYDSSSDDEVKKSTPAVTAATQLVAAPDVNVEVWSPAPTRIPCEIFGSRPCVYLVISNKLCRIKRICR